MEKKICSIDGCERDVKAKGYCNKHYRRFNKYGNPLYTVINRDHDDICSIEGCEGKHLSKGFCNKHYQRFNNYGDPLYVEKEIVMHGKTNNPEYTTWINMKERCYNSNSKDYHRYGGRGIKVCDEWKNSFINFYSDMGDKPFPKAQIDRKENDKGYNKSNCRWVTQLENRRNNSIIKLTLEKAIEIKILYNKKSMKVKDIAKIYSIAPCSVTDIGKGRTWKDA